MNLRTELLRKIYSENIYFAIRSYPLVFMMFPLMMILTVNPVLALWIIFVYVIFVVALGYGKIKFEEAFKQYSYLNFRLYDLDSYQSVEGWVALDTTETYPMKLTTADRLKIAEEIVENKQDKLKERKVWLRKQRNDLERMKENKDFLQLTDKEEKQIDKQIKDFEERIKSIVDEIDKMENIKERMVDNLEKGDIDTYGENEKFLKIGDNQYTAYRTEVSYCSLYDSNEIIMVLPTNLNNTFNFTDGVGFYDGLYIKNCPAVSSGVFCELDQIKGVPIILCINSSWHVKNAEVMDVRKQTAEGFRSDAEKAWLADELSRLKYEHDTLEMDNLDLEKGNNLLLDEMTRMDLRHREQLEEVKQTGQLSFEIPPQRLYAITIIGWISAGLFTVLYLISSL